MRWAPVCARYVGVGGQVTGLDRAAVGDRPTHRLCVDHLEDWVHHAGARPTSGVHGGERAVDDVGDEPQEVLLDVSQRCAHGSPPSRSAGPAQALPRERKYVRTTPPPNGNVLTSNADINDVN